MHKHSTKIKLLAAIGSTAVVALGLSPSSFAQTAIIPELGDEQITTTTKPKPEPRRCQGALITLSDGRYGLTIYKWAVCGRTGGVPRG